MAKLNQALLEYWRTLHLSFGQSIEPNDQTLYDDCLKIMEQLKDNEIGDHLEVIQPISDEKEFKLLAKTIKESIENNEPETALDRLHTFMVKFLRGICDKHKISYDRNKPLHSLLGEYIKHIKNAGHLESPMTERILKSSISVLQAFNEVRNAQSFAHDNALLNYGESILIFKNISSAIEFIQSIEQRFDPNQEEENMEKESEDDLPF